MEIYTNQNIGKFYVKEGSHARTRHNKLVISFFGNIHDKKYGISVIGTNLKTVIDVIRYLSIKF